MNLNGHQGPICGVAWSPDGATLATSDCGGNVRFWSPTNGTQTTSWKAHAKPTSGLAFSAEGKQLLTTSYGRDPKLWDAKTGTLIMELKR